MLKSENWCLQEFNVPDYVLFLSLQHVPDEIFESKIKQLFEHQKFEEILEVTVPATPECPLKGLHFQGR